MGDTSDSKLKLFISYSRQDTPIADRFVTELESRGFTIFIDRRDIPGGEEWLNELRHAIATSDTVVWLVSRSSVSSKACLWELGELQRQSKRLMPVAIEPATDVELPEAIGKIHLTPAVGAFSFDQHFEQLVTALNTDQAWLKAHTRLLEVARQWQEKSLSPSFLLRGSALQDAEAWRDRQPRTMPQPSSAVLDLILASRRLSVQRQRNWVAGAMVVAALGVGLAGLAFSQRQIAVQNEIAAVEARGIAQANERRAVDAQQAETEARKAETEQRGIAELNAKRAGESAELAQRNEQRALSSLVEAQRNLSLFRAQQAQSLVERNDPTSAVLLALESLPDRTSNVEARRQWPLVPEALALLDRTADANVSERQLIGHRSRVHRLEFSRTGERLATVGLDGAWLWDAEAGKPVGKLEAGSSFQGEIVWRGAFSPDGALLVTANYDGSVRRWNGLTGKLLGEFGNMGTDGVRQLAFSPTGARLAIGGSGGVILADVASGRLISRKNVFSPNTDSWMHIITALEFNREDTLFVAAGVQKDVHLLDAKTGAVVKVLSGHREAATTASFSNTEALLATGSNDGTVRIWDLAAGFTSRRTLQIADRDVKKVAFSPKTGELLVVSPDHLAIWDVSRGERLRQMTQNTVVDADWSADGRSIVSVSKAQGAAVWDAETGTRKASYVGNQTSLTVGGFSPDSRLLATGAESGAVTLWPLRSDRTAGPSPGDLGSAKECRTIAWIDNDSASGRALSAGESNNDRIETAEEFADVLARADRLEAYTMRATDVSGGRQRYEMISFDRQRRRAVTVAMDGQGSSWDQKVLMWDVSTQRLLKEFKGNKGRVHGAVFSPDGTHLLIYGDDHVARIWSVTGNDPPKLLLGHSAMITAGCFNGDGTKVVTGSQDHSIRLWDAASGRTLHVRASKLEGVWHAAFSDDDRWIIAGALAESRSVRDATSQPVELHRIFDDPQELVDLAKAKVARCLSGTERQKLILDREPPHWCIEMRKPPYDTAAWVEWLGAVRRGETAALPPSE